MKSHDKNVVDEINITPLTDIFLVLLIIMMVVAPMLNYRGLAVLFSPPSTETSESSEEGALVVAIDATGRFLIDGEEVARPDLANRLRQDQNANREGVSVEVDPEASLDSMTFVLDAAQLAGIAKITIEESGEAPAAEAAAQGETTAPKPSGATTTAPPKAPPAAKKAPAPTKPKASSNKGKGSPPPPRKR